MCLINCIGGAKIRLHNKAVAVLTNRIKGKGFTAEPGGFLVHQTVHKQADIEVRKYSDVSNPLYVDVLIVQQESDGASAPRRKVEKSDNIDCCEDLEGKFVSRNHILRKVLVVSCEFTLRPDRMRFLEGANLHPQYIHLQWIRAVPSVILPFFS